jgi:hypothetical protein
MSCLEGRTLAVLDLGADPAAVMCLGGCDCVSLSCAILNLRAWLRSPRTQISEACLDMASMASMASMCPVEDLASSNDAHHQFETSNPFSSRHWRECCRTKCTILPY